MNLTLPTETIISSDSLMPIKDCMDWCVSQLNVVKFNDLYFIVLVIGILLTMLAFTEFKYVRDRYWLDSLIKIIAMLSFATYLILNL
jgi:hypothetical protein